MLDVTWTDKEHREFYQRLRDLDKTGQSKLVLGKAELLLENSEPENDDFIKAAESLLIYWTTKLNIKDDEFRAKALLGRIQSKLSF